jgi:hypothetical protein
MLHTSQRKVYDVPMIIAVLLALLLPLVAYAQVQTYIGVTDGVRTGVATRLSSSTSLTWTNKGGVWRVVGDVALGSGSGSGSITNIAAGYGVTVSSGYGPEATVTVDTNIIASQAWVSGQGYTTLAQVWSAGALSNNWTGGAITLDAANSNTNTFGGFLVIGPARYQANGGIASGYGSWANNNGEASGVGSWANASSTASGNGSWANASGNASGEGSWANGGIASGAGSWANASGIASGQSSWANASGEASGLRSWAMGVGAEATHDSTFVWSDGTAIGSTTNQQVTVYSSNGIRLLGGPITGNGSLITNVNALTLGGVALAGLVRTNAALDRLRLNDGGGLTNLPVAATPATNAVMLRTGSFRNATTNDFLGGIITGSEALDTASGTSVALFNTVVNAATNIYSGSAWFVFPWPAGNDMTTLQLGFRKTGTSATNFPLTLGYSNRFTGATASMVLTGQAAAVDTTYWTNFPLSATIATQAVQGAEWFLRWDPTFGATTNTTPGYMGIAIQGQILK